MVDYLNIIKKYWFAAVMALLAFGIVYMYFEPAPPQLIETEESEAITGEFKEIETEPLEEEALKQQLDSSFPRIGILQDVTGGQKVLNYQTSGLARGRVLIKYNEEDEKSTLISTLINVPEVGDSAGYYGWLVDKDNDQYISIGEYSFTEDRITIGITASENLNEYEKYVVTLQEREASVRDTQQYAGDKFHILEGSISKN